MDVKDATTVLFDYSTVGWPYYKRISPGKFMVKTLMNQCFLVEVSEVQHEVFDAQKHREDI
jgi:hypothetical protein